MTGTTSSITFNGTPLTIETDSTVEEVLQTAGIEPTKGGIAVAVDDAVVPRSLWGKTPVAVGAKVEVITAFQGG